MPEYKIDITKITEHNRRIAGGHKIDEFTNLLFIYEKGGKHDHHQQNLEKNKCIGVNTSYFKILPKNCNLVDPKSGVIEHKSLKELTKELIKKYDIQHKHNHTDYSALLLEGQDKIAEFESKFETRITI